MKELVDAVAAATAEGASEVARTAGAAACRTLLRVLEVQPGESLAVAAQGASAEAGASTPGASIAEQMPQLIAMLGSLDINQLLDVAIERLRKINAAHPSASPAPPVVTHRMRIPFVPIPPLTGKGR